MGGIGFPELVVVLVIALIIFGPKKLPALGEGFGKAISGFKKGMSEGVKEAAAEQAAAAQEKKVGA